MASGSASSILKNTPVKFKYFTWEEVDHIKVTHVKYQHYYENSGANEDPQDF